MTAPVVTLMPAPRGFGGYRQRSRQPSRMLRFQFDIPAFGRTGLDELQNWLRTTIEIDPKGRSDTPGDDHPLQPVARFLECVLALAMAIRQGAGNPAFEQGALANLRRGPEGLHCEALAAIPSGLGMNDAMLERIYQQAIVCCGEIASKGRGQADLPSLLGELERLVTAARTGGGIAPKSTWQLLRCASELDIPVIELAGGLFQLGWGSAALRIDRSTTRGDTASGARLAQDKALTAELLRQVGLPAADHRLVKSPEEALAAAHELGWPVVVKPTDRDRGEGVTTGINDPSSIAEAFTQARRHSHRILVEKQVPGTCHRIFISGGELLYVVRRDPIGVHADGIRTVSMLIDDANSREALRPAWLRGLLLPKDALAQSTLASQGMELDSVPPAGSRANLRPIESTRWGGVDSDMTGTIHPENIRIAVAAAQVIGLETAGIDLITRDVSIAWHENGGVINEINYAPTLGLAEISRRHLPAFIRRHLQGDGRIPVALFAGDAEAARAAQERHARLCSAGLRSCLISGQGILLGSDRLWMQPGMSLFEQMRGCLLISDIDALTVWTADGSLLKTGLPVDRLVETRSPGYSGTVGPSALSSELLRLHQLLDALTA